MPKESNIEWTDSTWNPVTGCNKVSAGCENCYADRMAKRLKAMGVHKYRNGFKTTIHPDVVHDPINWTKPRMIFVNSMSDLFHDDVPFPFLEQIFDVMNSCPQHIFQILTKRSKKLKRIHHKLNWTENIWMGVSVESKEYRYRIEDLRKTNAHVKFISFEPLIASVDIVDLTKIDWAIVGGESGPKSRPIEEKWVLDIRKQCKSQKTKFFFKQWGGVNKKKTGRELLGKTYDEMPLMRQFSV